MIEICHNILCIDSWLWRLMIDISDQCQIPQHMRRLHHRRNTSATDIIIINVNDIMSSINNYEYL
jgi:hypothetical protein